MLRRSTRVRALLVATSFLRNPATPGAGPGSDRIDSEVSFTRTREDDLYASILCTAVRRVIAGDRIGVAEALS